VTPDTRAQLGGQGPAGGSGPRELLRYRFAQGRWVLAAMIVGTSVTGIDSTVVVVALPMIGQNLHAGFQGLQWTVTAYTLTLAALLLLAGSLSDRWGRRRVFLAGLGWFILASVLCAAAPGHRRLIAARAVQGAGGTLMTPASLAVIEAAFQPGDRTRAIGTWARSPSPAHRNRPDRTAARQAAAPLPPMLCHRAAPDRPCPRTGLRRSATA
jgi:hypothetical protein